MDYKNKLKLAKEALDSGSYDKETIEYIFPELAESEDEKIRKELIEFVKSRGGFKQEYIAWLEKQGEQKPTLPKWKYKKDNTTLLKDSLVLNKCGHMAKLSSGAIVSDVWVFDCDELAKLPKEELEKQGEQNLNWGEEDECYMRECIGAIATKDGWSFEEKRKTKHWLKALKDRYTWKPSDEQMEGLNVAKDSCFDLSYKTKDALKSLYKDLKKLK